MTRCSVVTAKRANRRHHVIVGVCLIIALLSNAAPRTQAQSARDLPPPSSNFTNIPSGSLVIAMDTTNQALVSPFNLKAYGLVHNLLKNGIPVMWAIRAGKAKDAVDFTATAQRIAPSATAATNYNFAAGPFIIHRDYAELARTRITAFAGNVAVYQLTQDALVDVRYTLTDRLNIAVSNVNTSIHTDIFIEAGITDYTVVDPTALSSSSCYTFHSEPHTSATAGIPNVKAFVQSGGNFLAQCLALSTYENTTTGRFQTTNGIVINNIGNTLAYPNADLPFSQFTGALEPAPGGSEQDYYLASGSTFQNNTHVHADDTGATRPTYAATVSKLRSGVGGMVYYLGGHSYNAATLADLNGRRMLLNAALSPAERPTGCNANFAAAVRTLSGVIYEDVNGDSLLSDSVPRPNVNVRLYADLNASGTVDAGDTYLAATTTNLSGAYSFQVSTAASGGNYLVAVDSKSVTPNAGFNSGATQGNVWAEQTYGDNPATATLDLGLRFGGRQGDVSDNFNTAATAMASNAYEHLARVALSTVDITNVNFGFSFNLVTTTRAGDATDDDTANARSVQGSLRQFIQNANAVGGANYMRFTPAVAANSGAGWRVNVTASLPAVTDANTTIDGTAYNNSNGTSIRDANGGSLGAGGTIGVDNLSLAQVARPELEITDAATVAVGLDLQANDAAVRRLSVFGFGNTANSDAHANIRIGNNFTGALIESNIIGASAADFVDPGAGARSGGDNIRSIGADNGTVRNNLIGFSAGKGFGVEAGSSLWTIENNEIRGNGIGNSNLDGIDFETGGTTNNIARGNLITANEGVGVDSYLSNGSNIVVNNTITANGRGVGANVETAGVRMFGTNNTIERNVISGNYGAGVMVTPTATNNLITRNSIFNNGTATNNGGAAASNQIGIDLQTSTDNITTGTSPYVTLNDANDADTGGNGLLNFPVLERATINGSQLTLTGFARPAASLELFIAAPDASGFGEGQTYLVTLTEGSAADTDATNTTYVSPFAGRNVGTDTTERFSFTIALPSGVTLGSILTATATVAGSTSEFSNLITIANAPPAVGLVKSVSPEGDITPGTDLTYTIAFTNTGGQSATGFRLIDPDPASSLRLNLSTDFKLDSAAAALGTTGLTTTFEYSNDNAATWTYTPVSAAGGAPDGYDRNVTHVRWIFTGNLSHTAPNNTGSVSFVVRVR
ncbi:MAG: right-handed parallel beta-helix repeat-containing protein [Pyrinomonadaceae bacterium MAG19_C2-C3]|nr:right-handed parallel beta-helix repeat-containing protein [Pyrinomonadaceae bacterium MAG19_C2-C3]